jgi:glutathionyl-hydroquinone reductase
VVRSAGGEFVRQDAVFRGWVPEGEPASRYHVYAALACGWSQRTIIVRKLKGLEDDLGVSYLHPYRDERGWRFTGGPFTDDVNAFGFLAEAYTATEPDYDNRISVPVLWDKQAGTIVSNESADIVRMLNDWGDPAVDLYPEPLQAEIESINSWVYDDFQNGVYRAGFARTQEAYDRAFAGVFDAMARLEALLGERRYLAGDEITLADWRLFPTLVRFDPVYVGHFKCNVRRIADYPALSGYLRDLFQHPGVAATVDFDAIKRHYYVTHRGINPTGIVPAGPALDLRAPHGREALGAAAA